MITLGKKNGQSLTKARLTKNKIHKHDISREAQQARILCWLKENPRLTTFEARARGIVHPAGRIKELREKGVKILTSWVTEPDDQGTPHRIAQYIYCGMAQEADNGK